MNGATKRAILRWIHLIFTIPVLGYVYGPPVEVAEYADAVRYFFAPAVLFTGYWMYSGFAFAAIGVALWLGAFQLFGSGGAILSQFSLFIVRKIWLVIRARQSK